jgi:hypothetical protein
MEVFAFLSTIKSLDQLKNILNSAENLKLKKQIQTSLGDPSCLVYAPYEYCSERYIRDLGINSSVFYVPWWYFYRGPCY